MKNIKNVSDDSLLAEMKSLAARERELLVEVLKHLREIETRRLFSKLKYKSLFEYCTLELGYSEDQAYRRIAAMRLIKDVPEVEGKLEKGTLSLAAVSVAVSTFKARAKIAPIQVEEKRSLLKALDNKSKRDAEVIAFDWSGLKPSEIKNDSVRMVGGRREIRFECEETTAKLIDEVRGLLAHKIPEAKLSDLIDHVFGKFVDEFAKNLTTQKRRVIFHRAGRKCENCGSKFALEVDHRVPKCQGGGEDVENLRLLCRNCNQRAAVEKVGREVMRNYI